MISGVAAGPRGARPARTVRAFRPADYERYVEVANLSYPEYGWTVEEVRHQDENWDHAKHFKTRLVSEEDGLVVGSADASHWRGRFNPANYGIELNVDPAYRRRGHGTALLDGLESLLRARGARLLRTGVKESMADGVRFAERHGFRELKRDWESRLDVQAFDEAPFASAFERVARQGVRITTLGAEVARDRQAALVKAFELKEACRADVPAPDPATPGDFEVFVKDLAAPMALLDAYFIAIDADGAWVGVSDLWASLQDPSFLWQGLTGVRREARGRGIAMALKLHGIRYAKAHGKHHIKTWNDAMNRPMLRINEALGFVKQPVWIQYQKDLASS